MNKELMINTSGMNPDYKFITPQAPNFPKYEVEQKRYSAWNGVSFDILDVTYRPLEV